MKLMPHLKKGLKLYIKDGRTILISFLILPMVLAFVYGNMQKNMFEGKEFDIEAAKVDFQYSETSIKGKILKEILLQDKVKGFIILEKEEAQYTVVINEDFSNIEMHGEDEGATQFIMLKNFVQSVVDNFNQQEVIQNTIQGLKLTETQRSELINSIMKGIVSNQEVPTFKEKIVAGYKTLSSSEYYIISLFSFTSLIMIVTLAGNFYKDVKEGIVKRTLSTPNDKKYYFLGFILTSFTVALVISGAYVIINRIRGIGFSSNPLYVATIVLMQSILAASVVGLVIAFIKKEVTANLVMNFVLVVPSVLGGVFFNAEFIGSKVIRTIMDVVPNTLILNSYKDLAITGSFQGIQDNLMIMAVLSISFLVMAMIKIHRKWEV